MCVAGKHLWSLSTAVCAEHLAKLSPAKLVKCGKLTNGTLPACSDFLPWLFGSGRVQYLSSLSFPVRSLTPWFLQVPSLCCESDFSSLHGLDFECSVDDDCQTAVPGGTKIRGFDQWPTAVLDGI